MKVLLVMPGVGRKPGESYVRSWLMEPLGLATLAAATPPNVDLHFADDRLEAIPFEDAWDLVGINVETYTARRAYAIARRFRARGVPVVMGGYHATLLPAEVSRHADAVVTGPADTLWPQVLADARSGTLQRAYRGTLHGAVRPRPDRSLYRRHRYLPVALVEAGRGCRFECDFCSVCQFYRHTAAARPIDDVLAEIAGAPHRDVFFVDDNVVADPLRARELFAALVPARIRWFSQGSLTMASDPELLRRMQESGCQGVLIGFESLSAETLKAMGKSWNRAARDYGEAVARLRDHGIPIYATFVFGYDTDDADAFERTVEFAIRQKFSMAAFNHLVPFPGTPLYERLRAAGRLRFDPWWLDPRCRFGDVAFMPSHMSPEELAERCYQARLAFYRFSSIARRAADFRANCRSLRHMASYFWVNLFSGRQMRKRQGLPLGEGFADPPEESPPRRMPLEEPRVLEEVP